MTICMIENRHVLAQQRSLMKSDFWSCLFLNKSDFLKRRHNIMLWIRFSRSGYLRHSYGFLLILSDAYWFVSSRTAVVRLSYGCRTAVVAHSYGVVPILVYSWWSLTAFLLLSYCCRTNAYSMRTAFVGSTFYLKNTRESPRLDTFLDSYGIRGLIRGGGTGA